LFCAFFSTWRNIAPPKEAHLRQLGKPPPHVPPAVISPATRRIAVLTTAATAYRTQASTFNPFFVETKCPAIFYVELCVKNAQSEIIAAMLRFAILACSPIKSV
jgi:hypothetical protein